MVPVNSDDDLISREGFRTIGESLEDEDRGDAWERSASSWGVWGDFRGSFRRLYCVDMCFPRLDPKYNWVYENRLDRVDDDRSDGSEERFGLFEAFISCAITVDTGEERYLAHSYRGESRGVDALVVDEIGDKSISGTRGLNDRTGVAEGDG